MTVEFIKQDPSYTKTKRRYFVHDNVSSQFVYLLYRFGFLDRILDRIDLEDMLNGHFANSPFDVHHIQPLTGGGDNKLRNLCLIEKNFHRFLNKHCFDPVLSKMQVGERTSVAVPNLMPVALYSDYSPFIFSVYRKQKKDDDKAWGAVAQNKKQNLSKAEILRQATDENAQVQTIQSQLVRERWLQLCDNMDKQTIKALHLIKDGATPARVLTPQQIRKQAYKLQRLKQLHRQRD